MRRLAVALLVASAACSSSVDAADSGSTTTSVAGVGAGAVLVVGDSLTHGATSFGDLEGRLERAGFDDVDVVAEDGRDVPWAIGQVEDLRAVPTLVVVELGTNPGPDTGGFADDVSEMVTLLRSRGAVRIAWLTPVHGRDDRYDDKVAILEAAEGIDTVADWASIVRDDPSRLAADGLHPTEDGYNDLARFLTRTAVALANR
jgi:hypothetical protein